MGESAVVPPGRRTAGPVRDAADEELDSLRSLLVGPEQHQLNALQARLDDPAARARDVGAVLARALALKQQDPELERVLAPPIERALTSSVRRNPAPLAEALFPIMGPAIRRAVNAAFAAMVESINRTLDHSLSWRALRWRITALRTGRSFAEVVLANTLLYRVEQVFLIDRSTGLLLRHVRAGPALVQDADMVSGMLTAIRDFVQDSFRVPEQATLDTLQVGELSVWIEQGPRAYIAAVIRGTPPQSLRQVLQDAVAAIHAQFAEALDAFNGDVSVFEPADSTLQTCLQAQFRSDQKPGSRLLATMVGILLIAAVAWAVIALRERRRWSAYVDALRVEPGMVVVDSGRRGGGYFVTGLRDPLARDPEALLAPAGFRPEQVQSRWELYQALQPNFVLARAREALQPPPGVTLAFRDGVLSASGAAPVEWVADARRLASLIPGVARFDAAGSLESRIRDLSGRIEGTVLLFLRGTSDPVVGYRDALDRVMSDIRQLDRLAGASGRTFRVEIAGHTDTDGTEEANGPLSAARAGEVLAQLSAPPLAHVTLVPVGMGSRRPAVSGTTEEDKQRNRRVTFRVTPAAAANEPR
jgi:OOP family OmpA-OmpF porin